MVYFFLWKTIVCAGSTKAMDNSSEYYIVDKRVLPEVYIKVVEAKRLLEQHITSSVQEAVDIVGVSRSAYYKYKDYVSRLSADTRGSTVIIAFNLKDEAGLLSNVLNVMAESGANILTINQTIPINGIANVTISMETGNMKKQLGELINEINGIKGLKSMKIIARE